MWVLGYGSLMWDNWEQEHGGTRWDHAVLQNYRRSFNKKSTQNWGSAQAPGPTLGLEPDQGASCVGTAFEFPDDRRAALEALLKQREGASFALVELPVRLADGREIEALTPVNDRTSGTYIGNARGTKGACADYVRNINEKLRALEIIDGGVDEFAALVGPD